MTPDGVFSDLTLRLYEAVEKPALWPVFLDGVRRACGAASANMSSRHLATGEERALQAGFDEREIRLYHEYYGKVHPWLPKSPAAFRHQPEVEQTESLLSLDHLRRTEFYNDWGRRNEVVFAAAARLQSARGSVLFLAVNRGERQGAFCDQSMNLLRQLLPHCKQAFRLKDVWDDALAVRESWRCGGGGGGLPPVFLLKPEGRVIDATEAAGRLLRTPGSRFQIGGHDLRLRIEGEQRRNVLPALIGRVQSAEASPGGQELLRLPATADQPECILVTRRRNSALELTVIFPGVLANAGPLYGQIAKVYELTPAEGRLFETLLTTGSLVEACKQLRISRETGKSQLAAIFRKTGTNSQTGLVRMAARFPRAAAAEA